MALQTYAGAFNPSSGVTGNLTISGVGFTPKAVIFYGNKRTGSTDGAATTGNWSCGFATGASNQGAICASTSNAGGTTADTRVDNSKCYVIWTAGTPTNAGQLEFVSFNSDGFVVNRTTAFTANYRIGFLAIGGSDLTDAKCGTFAAATTTGTQPVTGVGFQPDCVLLLGGNVTASLPANAVHASLGFGCMVNSTNRFALSIGGTDGSNGARRFGNTSHAFVLCTPDADSTDDEADYYSMDSDGFTLDWTKKSANARHMFYLALKGGSYAVGSKTTPAAATTFSITGLSFAPTGIVIANHGNSAASSGSTTSNDSAEMAFGAASGASAEWSAWAARVQSVGDADCRFENDAVWQSSAWSTGAVELLANVTAFTSDGVDFTETDYPGYVSYGMFLAMGDSPASAGQPTVKRWGGMTHMPGGSMLSPGRRRW